MEVYLVSSAHCGNELENIGPTEQGRPIRRATRQS